MSRAMTAGIRMRNGMPRARFFAGTASGADTGSSSVVTGSPPGSSVTLAPLTRGPPIGVASSLVFFVQPGQVPRDQPPARNRAARDSDREPDEDEDRAFTLDWLALTHSSISALVGPSRAAAPPRPPPPRA